MQLRQAPSRSETKLVIEKWEEESEELVKEERDMPPEYAGLTREELEKQLTVEIKDKSWEEEKEGLVKITLESFSEDKIVIRMSLRFIQIVLTEQDGAANFWYRIVKIELLFQFRYAAVNHPVWLYL